MTYKGQQGFTLIEISIIIGIIAILSGIVIAAINPLEQLQTARGTERISEANAIKNAVTQSILRGVEYTGVPTLKSNAIDICRSSATGATCTATNSGYDLSFLAPDYIADIPIDSSESGSQLSGYRLYKNGAYYEVCSPRETPGCGPNL